MSGLAVRLRGSAGKLAAQALLEDWKREGAAGEEGVVEGAQVEAAAQALLGGAPQRLERAHIAVGRLRSALAVCIVAQSDVVELAII